MSGIPGFIIVEADAAASDDLMNYVDAVGELVFDKNGGVIFARPADTAEPLEEGSEPRAVAVFKFPSVNKAKGFWLHEMNMEAVDGHFGEDGPKSSVVVAGIPEDGLPEEAIPTVANVTVPDKPGPRAYMLVQGTVSDPEPIGEYMATIIPMIKERGGVYRIWTPPDGPEVLAGKWDPQYIVLSEWPTIEEPRDFWYSDTYQNKAIPTRKPASDFHVLLFEARV